MTTYQVQLKRTVPCPPERAFQLWTDPALMAQWFCPPNGKLTLDVHPGVSGTYRFKVVLDDGVFYGCSGTYTTYEPPHRLGFTWHWDESSFDNGVSEVDISFQPAEDGTELVLTHTKLSGEISEQRHTQGWDGRLFALTALVLIQNEALKR